MHEFLIFFWRMLLLKSNPEDIPESKFLLFLVSGLYLFLNVITIALVDFFDKAFLLIILDILLLIVWVYMVLKIFKMQYRLTQTLIALFGTGIFFQLLSIPLRLGIEGAQGGLVSFSVLGFFIILLWVTMVYGYLISCAINRSLRVGVLFAASYFILSFQLAAQILSVS